MKKRYIQLIAAAVILIGMIAALLIIRKMPDNSGDTADSAEDAVYVVGSTDSAPPKSIEITNPSSSYSIESNGLTTTITGFENLSIDSYNLNRAVSSAQAMQAKELIVENATDEDLALYGFNPNRASARITAADNSTAEVVFGDNAPGGEGVYVKRADSNIVYLVSPSVAEPFFKPDTAYVSLSVTGTDPEFSGFERITLSGKNYPEPIVIQRTPDTVLEAGGMTFNTHTITSPVNKQAYQYSLEALNSVYGLMATNVAAVGDDAETLEKFGLRDPAISLSVTGAPDKPEMTFSLRISDTDEFGIAYLAKAGSPVIYEIQASTLSFIGLTLFDYMDKSAFITNIDTVSAITVTAPGKSYNFKLSGTSDELIVTVNGKELAKEVTKPDGSMTTGDSNFRQFYQSLLAASYNEETESAPAENAVPILSFTYELRNGGGSKTLRFYEGPTRKAYIQLEDGEYYLTTSAYVDRILEDVVKISNDEFVKSYL